MCSAQELVSRKDALSKGLRFYFTGKACRYGHVAERYVNGRVCAECRRQYD